jgi:hypothetical protein
VSSDLVHVHIRPVMPSWFSCTPVLLFTPTSLGATQRLKLFGGEPDNLAVTGCGARLVAHSCTGSAEDEAKTRRAALFQ